MQRFQYLCFSPACGLIFHNNALKNNEKQVGFVLSCEVAEDEKAYLQLCDETAICPQCQKPVPPVKAVGSGRIDEGKFCRLDCYALISGA